MKLTETKDSIHNKYQEAYIKRSTNHRYGKLTSSKENRDMINCIHRDTENGLSRKMVIV